MNKSGEKATGRARRQERVRQDLERYGGDILRSAPMRRACGQTHHRHATVAEHSLRVAAASLAICYALERLHIATDIPAVVKGALCHDLGILGRAEKYTSMRECSRRHPLESAETARALVRDLPDKSLDIIERHMWPVGHSKAPNSVEGLIVSAADKYAAVKDYLLGSRSGTDWISGPGTQKEEGHGA